MPAVRPFPSLLGMLPRLGLAVLALGLLALALALPVPASAAPAPWYWWTSKLDGKRVCAQSMPGQGWERGEGPFTQAGCQPARRSIVQRR